MYPSFIGSASDPGEGSKQFVDLCNFFTMELLGQQVGTPFYADHMVWDPREGQANYSLNTWYHPEFILSVCLCNGLLALFPSKMGKWLVFSVFFCPVCFLHELVLQ